MKREPQFVIYVGNKGYPASLELRKIYQVIPDKAASRLHHLRVIDEFGEDYLYPENYFVLVQLPQASGHGIGSEGPAKFWEGHGFSHAAARTDLDGLSR